MDGWLKRARIAGSMSVDECAPLLGVPVDEYLDLESYPGRITIDELSALCRAFGADGRAVVRDALRPMTRR